MRVLLVNDYLESGGCEQVMHRTAVGLRSRGHRVEICTRDDVGGRRTPWGYVENRRARRALRQRLEIFEPDVVHFFNVYHELSPAVLEEADRWRGGRSSRIVMTCADAHLVCPNAAMQVFEGGQTGVFDSSQVLGWRTLWMTRWDERSRMHSLLKATQHAWNYRWRKRWRCLDSIICASRFLDRSIERSGVPCVRIADPLPSEIPARSVDTGGDALRLVFCGRVDPEKGLAPFIEAVATIEGWTLDVVGDGRALEHVRCVVDQHRLGDRVSFQGRVSPSAAVERIALADVLVLPSRCNENAPASMFEALACGTGLLVGNTGGMPEIVEESGIGAVFDPFEASDASRALGSLIETHRAGGVHSVDASGYLAGRSVEKYLDRLEDLYTGGTGGMPCVC